jgi:hypothetical protein
VLVVPGAGAEDENEDSSLVTGRGEAALLRSMDRDRAPRTDMVTDTDMAMGLEDNNMRTKNALLFAVSVCVCVCVLCLCGWPMNQIP